METMTQENKELLLKDLCARLPYNTIVNVSGYLGTRNCRLTDVHHRLDDYIGVPDCMQYHIDSVKPYLFPLSSMTNKQRDYIHKNSIGIDIQINNNGIVLSSVEGYEWLNKNHFDYRGLIEKGLAIDANGLNIY